MTETPKEQQPGAQGTRVNPDDALDKDGNVIPEKLRKNQQKLNVGPDHQTPDMKKRHRAKA